MGLGVLFSAATVLVYQGLLTLAALMFKGLLPAAYLDVMSSAGGLLVLGIGLNLTGNLRIKVANLLPAIFLAPVLLKLAYVFGWIR
jgi:hypothetical protein